MPRGVRKTTYQNLMGQIEKLRKQADAVRGTEVKSVIQKIKEQMNQYNISASDLGGASGSGTAKRGRGRPRKNAATTTAKSAQATQATGRKNKAHTRRKAEIKFRDPVSGATWSGRGRTPKWIATAKGKTKQDFAIA